MHPAIKKYNENADKFIKGLPDTQRKSLPVLTTKPESQNALTQWVKYFDHHVGARPAILKALLAGRYQSMTVPAQDPMWFDATYEERPGGDPVYSDAHCAEMRRKLNNLLRPTYEQLKAKYGPTWGITNPDRQIVRRPVFRSPAEISAEWEAEYRAKKLAAQTATKEPAP